jgi:hypothetical protein
MNDHLSSPAFRHIEAERAARSDTGHFLAFRPECEDGEKAGAAKEMSARRGRHITARGQTQWRIHRPVIPRSDRLDSADTCS